MNNRKFLLGIALVFGIMFSTLMASAEENISAENVTLNPSSGGQVFTMNIGEENDELGYSGDSQVGYRGPQAFAVENGVAYILDTVHGRISVYDSAGWKYNIVLTDCSEAELMKFQNEIIGVVDNQSAVTGIYSAAGNLIKLINHPECVDSEYVTELSEIGDTYVIWRTIRDNYYMYDWVDETYTAVTNKDVALDAIFEQRLFELYSDSQAAVSNRQITVSDSIGKSLRPLGIQSGDVIYEQYEYISDVDMLLGEYSLRKVSADGLETYAIVDVSDWCAPALMPFYVSSDGTTYVMENLDSCVKISQVDFGTTDVSQMSQLETLAEERRLKMTTEIETCSMTSDGIYKRSEARSRADGMTNLSWVVRACHQVVQGVASLPAYIADATPGDVVVGIPYCWGGFNGIDDAGSGYTKRAFASVALEDGYMAGDVNADDLDATHRSNTIGLDCSGFVSSAYGLTTKYGTSNFRSYGRAVTVDDLKMSDYLVNGGHIVLLDYNAGNLYVIYESTTDGGKTRRIVQNAAWVDNNDYSMRSPYHASCDSTNAYIDNGSSGHTILCTECGHSETESHTYEDPFHVCVVCGHAE